jgi:hypothetical protein
VFLPLLEITNVDLREFRAPKSAWRITKTAQNVAVRLD